MSACQQDLRQTSSTRKPEHGARRRTWSMTKTDFFLGLTIGEVGSDSVGDEPPGDESINEFCISLIASCWFKAD